MRSTGALSLWFSSIALPLFSIPVTLLHGLVVPPPGCLLPFLSPPPSLCPGPPLGARVASAELELHTVVVRACRNCDGLNGTVELLTSGPEVVHTWVPRPRSKASNCLRQRLRGLKPRASVIYMCIHSFKQSKMIFKIQTMMLKNTKQAL